MEPPSFIQIGSRIVRINAITEMSWNCCLWVRDEKKQSFINQPRLVNATPEELNPSILEANSDAPKYGTMDLTITIANGHGSFTIHENDQGGSGYFGKTIELKGVEAWHAWQKMIELLPVTKII